MTTSRYGGSTTGRCTRSATTSHLIERFAIPRDNIPNSRRKQLLEQFMRRTRLVLNESRIPVLAWLLEFALHAVKDFIYDPNKDGDEFGGEWCRHSAFAPMGISYAAEDGWPTFKYQPFDMNKFFAEDEEERSQHAGLVHDNCLAH
ncbi:hypothetical protein Dimus_016955 [Dionaea muscipula]